MSWPVCGPQSVCPSLFWYRIGLSWWSSPTSFSYSSTSVSYTHLDVYKRQHVFIGMAVFAAAEQIKRNIAFRRRFVYHLTHTSCPFHSEHPGERRRCMPFSFLHPQSVRIFWRTASYFPIFLAVQFNKRRSAPMFILIIPQQEKSSRAFS